MEKYEVVVVGSPGVGKSCLTIRFLKDEFSNDYDPTVEENYTKVITVDGASCQLSIVDTAGQQEYATLRDHHLSTGDGYIIVFALNQAPTLDEAKQLRDSIVKVRETTKLPIMLVGNKVDMVDERQVEFSIASEYAQSVKASYLEASAKSNINVLESFSELVRQIRKGKAAVSPKEEKEGPCCSIL